MAPQTEVLLIAVVVAAACALPGVFLVLRQMSLMSDAISHSVLLGIVIGFFITGRLDSPLLLILAAGTGVLTVSLVELLHRTQLVKEDAAIGIVFPALFSLAVILITRYAGNVHLDQDVVLLGEIALAPFDRVTLFGLSLPYSLVVMGTILTITLSVIVIFYKELKISTFDPGLAAALGFSPGLLHYGLMSLTSIIAVGAFDAVGAILVVALMIVPPATAYLLTDQLFFMLIISFLVGIVSAVSGYGVAIKFDASIAGDMAMMTGTCFLLTFLLAPQRGLLAIFYRRFRQKFLFAQQVLLTHLVNHEGIPSNEEEDAKHMKISTAKNRGINPIFPLGKSDQCHLHQLHHYLCWDIDFTYKIVNQVQKQGLVQIENEVLRLTNSGRQITTQTFIQRFGGNL